MVKSVLGIIGGSGLYDLPGLENKREEQVKSPWGEPSSDVHLGDIGGLPIAFVPRHGAGHKYSPTTINYRANINALKRVGVTDLVVEEKEMIVTGQLEQSCSRNVFGENAPMFHVDERVPRAVDDQGWHVNRGQDIADIDLVDHPHERDHRCRARAKSLEANVLRGRGRSRRTRCTALFSSATAISPQAVLGTQRGHPSSGTLGLATTGRRSPRSSSRPYTRPVTVWCLPAPEAAKPRR